MKVTFEYLNKKYNVNFEDGADGLTGAFYVASQTPRIGIVRVLEVLTEISGGTIEDSPDNG